jgi:septum formation protein
VRLVLASASPRRAELLAAAGFSFDVLPVEVDERVRAGELPDVYVRRLAQEKSLVASGATSEDVCILGADTGVVIDGEILGKPRDGGTRHAGQDKEAAGVDARSMLRRLSGRHHDVLTGVSLRRGSVELGRVERTTVFFASLGDEEIEWYVQSGEGRDKAGGYAIQGLASRFVQRIEGSYSNVVGLPISVVHELLQQIAPGQHLT